MSLIGGIEIFLFLEIDLGGPVEQLAPQIRFPNRTPSLGFHILFRNALLLHNKPRNLRIK